MFEQEPTSEPVSFSIDRIEAASESELDQLPFGVVGLDSLGFVLRYNLYESRLARLDKNEVIGRSFFDEIARCAKTDTFFGRFQRMLAAGRLGARESFDYVFGFAFGEQKVTIEMVLATSARIYLIINRNEVGSTRTLASDIPLAIAQRALAPHEIDQGVRRDALERRFVDVPAPFFAALRATCERLAPESWQIFATEWGVQWGRRTAIDLEGTALERGSGSLGELSMTEVARLVSATFSEHGWGKPSFDFGFAAEGVLQIEVQRSALANAKRAIRNTGGTSGDLSCHLLAGCFSGMMSHVAERRLSCREVACRSAGNPACSFVLVAQERRGLLDEALGRGVRGYEGIREALRRTPSGGAND